jgi:acyl carrier protein
MAQTLLAVVLYGRGLVVLTNDLETDAGLADFLANFLTAVDFQQQVVVSAETRLEDLPEWDSLAALGVIVMCDAEYNVTITGDDLKVCKTVSDIFSRVELKKPA